MYLVDHRFYETYHLRETFEEAGVKSGFQEEDFSDCLSTHRVVYLNTSFTKKKGQFTVCHPT